jgi:hypothetical protein
MLMWRNAEAAKGLHFVDKKLLEILFIQMVLVDARPAARSTVQGTLLLAAWSVVEVVFDRLTANLHPRPPKTTSRSNLGSSWAIPSEISVSDCLLRRPG